MKTIRIPERVQPDWFTNRYRDRYLYVIHKIIEEHFLLRKQPDDYIALSGNILKQLLGTKYTEIRNELVKQEIIETKPIGKVELKQGIFVNKKGYRLHERYWNDRNKYYTLQNGKLKRKLETFKDTADRISELQWLKNPMRDITINAPRALEFINDTYNKPEDNYRYEARKYSIDNIMNDPLHPFKADDKSGRVYNAFSSTPKDIIVFVSVRGNAIVSLDVSCSHLYHFNPLVKAFIEKELDRDYYYTNVYGEGDDLYSEDLSFNDVKIFEELTCTNGIYQYFYNKLNCKTDYKKFKQTFFQKIQFSRNPSSTPNRFHRLMDSDFPNISRALRYYKDNTEGFYTDREDKFKNFPIKLQTMERENIVDRIAKNLINNNPNMFVSTVHDCILTTEGNEGIALNEMQRVFKEQYGNTPTIKTKRVTIGN